MNIKKNNKDINNILKRTINALFMYVHNIKVAYNLISCE